MKRRTFLYLSIAASAAIGVPYEACRNQNGPLNKVLRQPRFLSHVCDEKTLREIGKAYAEGLSTKPNQDELEKMLLTDGTGKVLPSSADSTLITSSLNNKIQQDFDAGRTVVVKGWVLSATEAQQCALFSMS